MTSSATHILLVDDDAKLRQLITAFLSDKGYRVSTAENAEAADRKLKGMIYDLIILDVMMPGLDGFSFLKKLRTKSTIPVLMLSAKSEVDDRITGLEGGADDYLSKPFEPKELILRIRNILKRASANKPIGGFKNGQVKFGPYTFNRDKQILSNEEKAVHLTTAELNLLSILARQPGKAITREQLMEQAELSGELRTVDVTVTRLRRKVEVNPRYPLYIQTVRNKGYVLKTD